MRHLAPRCLILLLAIGMIAGCATRYSSQEIRTEIERQSGNDPLTAFEMNLGRFTTFLIKSALSVDAESESTFAGLDQLQVAVQEVPPDAGPAIDVTQLR